jgi:hypothetical protein
MVLVLPSTVPVRGVVSTPRYDGTGCVESAKRLRSIEGVNHPGIVGGIEGKAPTVRAPRDAGDTPVTGGGQIEDPAVTAGGIQKVNRVRATRGKGGVRGDVPRALHGRRPGERFGRIRLL